MFCHKCGMQALEGAMYCQSCGTKLLTQQSDSLYVSLENVGANKIAIIKAVHEITGLSLQKTKVLVENMPALVKKIETQAEAEFIKTSLEELGATVTISSENTPSDVPDFESEHGDNRPDQAPPTESSIEKEPSKFRQWWNASSKLKKVLFVLGTILACSVALWLLISFLREFGALLCTLLAIVGLLTALFVCSKEERIEARKTLVTLVVGVAIIGAGVVAIILNPDFLSNIFQAGMGVRSAYLTQYSEDVTIEEAFENYFDNEKWSTYKSENYSYVVFTGNCDYFGQRADIRLTFKITGEQFRVDSLDINGVTQNDLIMYALLATIYEGY